MCKPYKNTLLRDGALFLCCNNECISGWGWVLGLRVDWAEEDQSQGDVISVPPEVYKHGCVRDVDHGLEVSVEEKKSLIVVKAAVGKG